MSKDILQNTILWTPSDERIKTSVIYDFMNYVNNTFNLSVENFNELHDWSIKEKSDILARS